MNVVPYHFFDYDEHDFAFRVFDDVIKVYPVVDGFLNVSRHVEIPLMAGLYKAAYELINGKEQR